MEKTNWILDPAHSSVQFEVKHLMIASLMGQFNEIEASIQAGDNFENAEFIFTANVNSIFTNDEKRDNHLKSTDFFEAEKFSKIVFKSTSFTRKEENIFELSGNLSIKEISKPIILSVKYGGIRNDNWGNTKAGFQLTGKLNRSDFGLIWNAVIEAGGVLVGDEVKIISNIELFKK